ncbi:MAG TPA: hypothetical protein VFF94_03775, partial [Novosphingobium sp.]|nr:hypothetical protein [Novosphingobium sp.]
MILATLSPPPAAVTSPLQARPHPWRWVSGAVLLLGLAWLGTVLARSPGLQWSVVAQYLGSRTILLGLWATLWLT